MPSRFQRQFSPRRGTGIPWVAIGVVVLILVILVLPFTLEHVLAKTVTFKVTDKASRTSCSSSGQRSSCKDVYFVYTDGGTYQDKDSWAFFKFDSSDVYGQLQRGHRYTCEVTGVRIPLFSTYRNIINCTPAK